MGAVAIAVDTGSKTDTFEKVALAHMDSLYRSALYMARNENDAQDLVQDTYLRAYKFFDKFKEGTNCRAWLLRILRNTFVNTIRRDKRRPQIIHLPEMMDHGVELPADTDPEDWVFGDLFDDDMTAAISELPEEYRTAVLLADVEGLSYKEIADVMDCPTGTVMSRLHRGRGLLREKLQGYAAQYGYAESSGND
ncbi:sigma-70 family RNA polymerase sigma factor [Candidatus Poribacteria bacterium]